MTSQEIEACIAKAESAGSSEAERWLREIALHLAVQNERNAAGDAVNRLLAKAAESRNLADPEPCKTDAVRNRGEKLHELYGAARNLLKTEAPENLSNYMHWRRLAEAVEAVAMLPARLPKDFERDQEAEGYEPPRPPSMPLHEYKRGPYLESRLCGVCGAGEFHAVHRLVSLTKTAEALRSCARTIQENRLDSVKAVDYLLKYAESVESHEAGRAADPLAHQEPDNLPSGFKPYCRWCRLKKTSWAQEPICPARPKSRVTEIRYPAIAPDGSGRWGLWYGEGPPARSFDTEAEAEEHLRNVLES